MARLIIGLALLAVVAFAQQAGEQKAAPECKKLLISAETKQAILNALNSLRSKVATGKTTLPKASDMLEVKWDDGLEQSSRTWASQCNFKASEKKERLDKRFFGVREILVRFSTVLPIRQRALDKAIANWAVVPEGIKPEIVNKFTGGTQPVRAFVQQIWSTTHYVGCSLSSQFNGKKTQTYFVCHFGNTGNIDQTAAYKHGEPCSACPKNSNCSKQNEGLCQI
eukprot:TRINITY_DN20239_c0_g1_i1.p1 TRINITY_DN20239_c0_g1~~TRINITY_DN20239_c0_g1_i1.p1  ORF type:complete len:224 (+),score=50.36 TRINITY_DN20239_c0_g1_i1:123-794(+)